MNESMEGFVVYSVLVGIEVGGNCVETRPILVQFCAQIQSRRIEYN
jgi:hypothetical protein